jgi:hypothetical protein
MKVSGLLAAKWLCVCSCRLYTQPAGQLPVRHSIG